MNRLIKAASALILAGLFSDSRCAEALDVIGVDYLAGKQHQKSKAGFRQYGDPATGTFPEYYRSQNSRIDWYEKKWSAINSGTPLVAAGSKAERRQVRMTGTLRNINSSGSAISTQLLLTHSGNDPGVALVTSGNVSLGPGQSVTLNLPPTYFYSNGTVPLQPPAVTFAPQSGLRLDAEIVQEAVSIVAEDPYNGNETPPAYGIPLTSFQNFALDMRMTALGAGEPNDKHVASQLLLSRYKTEELHSEVLAEMRSGTGTPHSNPYSEFSLSPNGKTLTLKRTPFKLTYIGEPGVQYILEWYENFYPAPNNATTLPSILRREIVTGTGVEATKQFVLEPPTSNGRREVEFVPNTSTVCIPGEGALVLRSVDIKIDLGGTSGDQSAGWLRVRSADLADSVFTPAAVKYGPYVTHKAEDGTTVESFRVREGVSIIKNGSVITQFVAPQIAGNIVPHEAPNGPGFSILCYPRTSILGTPFTTNGLTPNIVWSFWNPTPTVTSPRTLLVQVERNPTSQNPDIRRFKYVYHNATQTWEMHSGGDISQNAADVYVRKEEHATSGDTQIRTVSEGATIKAKKKLVYSSLSGSKRLTDLIENPDAIGPRAPLTNKFVYDRADRHILSIYPGNTWSSNVFDSEGRLTKTVTQFLDSKVPDTNPATTETEQSGLDQAVVTRFSYASVDPDNDDELTDRYLPRQIVKEIRGVPVSREYSLVSARKRTRIVCQQPYPSIAFPGTPQDHAVALNDSQNIRTETTLSEGPLFPGLASRILNPDGTLSTSSVKREVDLSDGKPYYTVTIREGQREGNGATERVKNGIETTRILTASGALIEERAFEIRENVVQGTQLAKWKVEDRDEFDRPKTVRHLDDRTTGYAYNCCGQTSFTDKDGTVTRIDVDSLRRPSLSWTEGIDVRYETVYDVADRIIGWRRYDSTGAPGSAKTLESRTVDLSGLIYQTSDVFSNTSSISESYIEGVENYSSLGATDGTTATRRVVTSTLQNAGTIIETFNADGTLARRVGTASFPVRYRYGVVSGSSADAGKRFVREIRLDTQVNPNGVDTDEWVERLYDGNGRLTKTVYPYPDGAYSLIAYDHAGRVVSERDVDGVTTLTYYDALGRIEFTGIAANPLAISSTPRPDLDRLQKRIYSYATRDSKATQIVVTEVFFNATQTGTEVRRVEEALDGSKGWRRATVGPHSAEFQTEVTYPGTYLKEIREKNLAVGNSTAHKFERGRVISVISYDLAGDELSGETYQYEAGNTSGKYGRLEKIRDIRNSMSDFKVLEYNDADQITKTTYPIPAPNNSESVKYTAMGQPREVTGLDGAITLYDYHPNGLLWRQSGARTYPAEYSYTSSGRIKTLKTWRTFSGFEDLSYSSTKWFYRSNGTLERKEFDNGVGPTFEISAAGRLKAVIQPHNIANGVSATKTLQYRDNGDLWKVRYSGLPSTRVTPNQEFEYDRLGNLKKVIGTAVRNDVLTTQSRDINVDVLGLVRSEQFGPFTFSKERDAQLRQQALVVTGGGSDHRQEIEYKAGSSRVDKIQNTPSTPTLVVQYGYEPDSPLISSATFQYGVNLDVQLSAAKTYDKLGRLKTSKYSKGTQVYSGAEFGYNSSGLIGSKVENDTAYARNRSWQYQYNSRRELQSARRMWADGTFVAGHQFTYAFDTIGNRTSSSEGGNAFGAEYKATLYSPDSRNQIDVRRNPGSTIITGRAAADSTISVNQVVASRKDDYFAASVPVDNSSGAQFATLNIRGVRHDSTVQKDLEIALVKKKYVPPATEDLTYDDSGNLLADARWDYLWDAENRLIEMHEKAVTGGVAFRKKLVFDYDYMNRRARKRVYSWDGSATTIQSDTGYIYDGLLVIAEFNWLQTPVITKRYFWGPDASGDIGGLGGAGGLLAIVDGGNTYFVAYGDNSNVSALINAQSGSVDARYEYGPFGTTLRESGLAANSSPFRFSTKMYDPESELIYYGHRYYSPDLGRWISRDPIQEAGGLNVNAFALNSPANIIDPDGRDNFYANGASLSALSIQNAPVAALINQVTVYKSSLTVPLSFVPSAAQITIPDIRFGSDGTKSVGRSIPLFTHAFMERKPTDEFAFSVTFPPADPIVPLVLLYGEVVLEEVPSMILGGVAAKGITLLRCAPRLSTKSRYFTSLDKHVGPAASRLESLFPGSVRGVNTQIRMQTGRLREVDIDLEKVIIQVKKDKAEGLAGQIVRTQQDTAKKVIGYAPDNMPYPARRDALEKGIPIARDFDELAELVEFFSK